MHEGFAGNSGEPKASSGRKNTGRAEGETGRTNTLASERRFPRAGERNLEIDLRYGGARRQTKRRQKRSVVLAASLYRLKAGERVPSEPGSREGGGRVMELMLRNMTDTQRSEEVSTVQQRRAELARERPNECFTALNHYLTVDWLKAAFYRVKPDSAPGVDGQSWSEYLQRLDENLRDLLDRIKSGSYWAPPVKRVHIPKDGKEMRGIGMPTIEDKVVQRAIAMLLEPIFEQDFKDFSYGFRPGRSAHEALARIWSQCTNRKIQWIVEVDIRKYFDTLKKAWLRKFLDRRVRDGVIRRLIDKWLQAGVWEKGQVSYPEDGTPQGGVISPLLSNIYLHEVLDCWFVQEVLPRMKGYTFLVRFADDCAPRARDQSMNWFCA
jgi:retron-type reverse transcriptase